MKQIFEQNPHLKVVFATSDEQAFYQEGDARNHAKTLDVKTVEPVYNPAHLEVDGATDESEEAKEMQAFEAAEAAKAAAAETAATDEAAAAETAATDEAATDEAAAETAATDEAAQPAATTKPLSKMTKAELIGFAKENSLTIQDPEATNAALVKEIEAELISKK